MSTLLNAAEIIDFAVHIEQNGYKFYVETMKKLDNRKTMQLFQFLADEEFKHENLFKELKKEVGNFTPPESYPGEYRAYMENFLKIHALGDSEALDKKIDDISTIQDALKLALEFEKDSIVLFTMIRDFVGDAGKGIVEKVIQEELTHIFKINDFYRNLTII